MKLLFLDTEYFAPSCLATGHLSVVDSDCRYVLGDYGFSLKHDVYTVVPGAVKVNKLDVLTHHEQALDAHRIGEDIRKFLKKHSQKLRDDAVPSLSYINDQGVLINQYDFADDWEIEKLQPVGHAIESDIERLVANFPNCGWYSYCKRNVIDTLSLARAAEMWGLLNVENIKLETLARHFGMDYDAHIASNDVDTNIYVYNELHRVLRGIS